MKNQKKKISGLLINETIEDLEKEAIEWVQNNLSHNEEIFVGFSGGKDSICCAKLMELSGLKYKLFYSFTGIDAPEVVKFIRKNYPDCIFLKPKRTFWKELSVNVPPSLSKRWCCTSLKKEPAKQVPHIYRVLGIRAEESSRRSKYGRISYFYYEKNNQIYYHPIFYWKEWAVWEFIEKYDLSYPVLYDLEFNRIGCVVCPYHSEKQHQLQREKWPKFYDLWEKEVDKLWNKRKEQGKTMFHDNAQSFLDAWYKNSMAPWYRGKEKKTEGGLFEGSIH
jgi:phosphoadenosine phosphosulfate reductase